jgi:hypothetical protein
MKGRIQMAEVAEKLVSQEDVSSLLNSLKPPYIVMQPGDMIYPGCLVGNPSTGTWQLTGAEYWNTLIEGRYIHFAEPYCPIGFKAAYGDVVIADNARIWRKTAPYWANIPPAWRGVSLVDYWHDYPSKSASRFKHAPSTGYLLAADAIVCNPVEDSWRTKFVPDSYRELHVNEIIRKGDRSVTAAAPDWTFVAPGLYGVKTYPDMLQEVRFCRAIPSKWHNWYVDLRRGRGSNKKNKGDSISRACASVEAMLQKIQISQTITNTYEYGIIWDVSGVPVHVLDVPIDAPPERTVALQGALANCLPNSISWLIQNMRMMGENIGQSTLLTMAHEALPAKHRELSAAEVCQEHDLIFALSPGERLPLMWQPCAPRLWHQPGGRYYIFARHEDAPTLLESAEIRLLQQDDRLKKVELTVNNILTKLDGIAQYMTSLDKKEVKPS